MIQRDTEFLLDEARTARIGFGEAMFCAGKSPAQIAAILDRLSQPILLTRLDPQRFAALPPPHREALDYDPVSQTAFSGAPQPVTGPVEVVIVTAGHRTCRSRWRRCARCVSRAARPS